MDPSERIDKHIAELTDWRGQLFARLRKLILEADYLHYRILLVTALTLVGSSAINALSIFFSIISPVALKKRCRSLFPCCVAKK